MAPKTIGRGILAILAFSCLAVAWQPTGAQQPADANPQPAGAWTLDEARAHLRLYPRDAYMQYVALQLARTEGNLAEVASEIQRRNPRTNQWAMRRDQVDLFSIFSGQLAVQESLQLDAMAPPDFGMQPGMQADIPVDVPAPGRRGPRPLTAPGARPVTAVPADSVPVSELVGPTVKSHPWAEMLAGRSPNVTGLALSVPADDYFISFRSVNKLLDAADLATLWGAHALNQARQEAQTQLVGQRLREQLAVEANPELRPFYDAVVDEVAVVGGDLFLREGSDVTMLFTLKQPAIFRAKMNLFLLAARSAHTDARQTEGEYLGVDYIHVASPDMRVHVFSAYPKPDLHVRSNSRAGLERVLEAIAGRDAGGEPVQRLGETDEFRYVRTLLPQGVVEEDGLVYLSDPFVRRLMSPALRLTERRRLVCYNHLRMIGHAGLMHRTQTGKLAHSFAELTAAGCAPGEFGQGAFACPEHGEYTLGDDGLTGVCSHHGYASYLTPCLDVETKHVTDAEAQAYRQFVEQYNAYWRNFFDPIAVRLQITPERYRMETIVLPLIDNSIYRTLSRALGGAPEQLDALPVPQRNIFSVAVRLDKAQILQDMGLEQFIDPAEMPAAEPQTTVELRRSIDSLRQLVIGMLNHESARKQFPAANKNGLSWRVALLPFIEQQALYQQFHHDEPWDSEHNRALVAKMPALYRSGNAKLDAAGKTRFVVPRGADTIFQEADKGASYKTIVDGTSNTAMILEADDAHAVIWTKPDDVTIDPTKPVANLQARGAGPVMAFADGHIAMLRRDAPANALRLVFTQSDGEVVNWDSIAVNIPDLGPDRRMRGEFPEFITDLQLGQLLAKGLGNQIGFHVYDAEPMFDLGLARFMGMMFANNRGRVLDDDFLFLFPLVGALNGPVYVSIPVKDSQIVDRFLDNLDRHLVEWATYSEGNGFFNIDQDFYRLDNVDGRKVRAYGFQFGPVKWRFFWSRIGNGLYIASKREVLDDLAALNSDNPADNDRLAGSVVETSHDPGAPPQPPASHALIRVRPQNWDKVLTAYRLGWEENNRQACLQNLGPLNGLTRSLASSLPPGESVTLTDIDQHAARVYDVHHFCPDDGHYIIAPDGRTIACTAHGTSNEPKQTEAPPESSELGRLLQQFRDMSVTLTFLEDGLHAVVTLDRQPNAHLAPGQ